MQLFIVDESGSPRIKRAALERLLAKGATGGYPDPWYVVAAVSIPETKRVVANDYILRTKRGFLPGYDPQSEETEIKGSHLFRFAQLASRKMDPDIRAWSTLTWRQVDAVIESVFGILQRLEAVIFAVAANQKTLYDRPANRKDHRRFWRAHHWAFTYLQQRACEMLEYKLARTQQGIFLMDRHSAFGSSKLMTEFANKRQEINRRASWPQQFDTHLLEQLVLVDSHVVQLVQLADVVAFCVARGVRLGRGDWWFKKVEPYLATRWGTTVYDGAGLTILS